MKIAIRDQCVHESLDRAFEIAKNLGFSGVEISLGGRKMQEHPIWSRAGLRQIIDFLQAARVEIPTVNVRHFNTYGLAHNDRRVREHAVKLFTALAARASTLGISAVAIPFRGSQSLESAEQWQLAVESLRECLGVAEAYGCAILIGASLAPEEALRLVETLDSHLIMLDYDILDAALAGRKPEDDLRALHEIIYQIRVRDVTEDQAVCPIGTGTVAFEPIVETLDEAAYDDYYVIDAPPGPDAVASAAANLATIQEMFLWS